MLNRSSLVRTRFLIFAVLHQSNIIIILRFETYSVHCGQQFSVSFFGFSIDLHFTFHVNCWAWCLMCIFRYRYSGRSFSIVTNQHALDVENAHFHCFKWSIYPSQAMTATTTETNKQKKNERKKLTETQTIRLTTIYKWIKLNKNNKNKKKKKKWQVLENTSDKSQATSVDCMSFAPFYQSPSVCISCRVALFVFSFDYLHVL